MLSRAKLGKILKILLLTLSIGLAVVVIVVFKKEAPKILGMYYLLYIRPELFVIAAYAAGQNPILIFAQVLLFSTFMTWLTWFFTGVAQKKISQQKKEGRFNFLKKYRFTQKILKVIEKFQNWLDKSREKYRGKIDKILAWTLKKSRYLLFVLFLIPIPMLDMSCVIVAKLIKLPYAFWIFIFLNACRFLIVLLATMQLL